MGGPKPEAHTLDGRFHLFFCRIISIVIVVIIVTLMVVMMI